MPLPPPTQDLIKGARGEAAETSTASPPKVSRLASRRARAPRPRLSRCEDCAAGQTRLAQTSDTQGRPNPVPGRSSILRRSAEPVRLFTPSSRSIQSIDFSFRRELRGLPRAGQMASPSGIASCMYTVSTGFVRLPASLRGEF